jgi:hypothetical protein
MSYTQSLLQPDIWYLITGKNSLTTSRELSCLCRTSRTFLNLFRPTLYRTVLLTEEGPHHHETLKLLVSDPDLAKHVVNFTLELRGSFPLNYDLFEEEHTRKSFVGAIQNMTSLKSLNLYGDGLLFHSSTDQIRFVECLSGLKDPLESFGIHVGSDGLSLASHYLPIPRLSHLTLLLSYLPKHRKLTVFQNILLCTEQYSQWRRHFLSVGQLGGSL